MHGAWGRWEGGSLCGSSDLRTHVRRVLRTAVVQPPHHNACITTTSGVLCCGQVHSSSLLLSESPSCLKRQPFVRVECRGCHSQARLQPSRLAATVDIASMTAVDLCSHSHGIPELLLQRCPQPGGDPLLPSLQEHPGDGLVLPDLCC